jgi:hypothetical protein
MNAPRHMRYRAPHTRQEAAIDGRHCPLCMKGHAAIIIPAVTTPGQPSRPRAFAGLAAALALYLALALPQLDLPGLHNDEAVEGGLQASQILDGRPITAFRDAGLSLGGRTWPLMVQDYIGAFNVYLPLPFFALFGHTAVALRLYAVALGALTLALAYGLARDLLGPRAALLTGLLLAVSPSFVFWQRQGVFVTSITATLAVGMLWAGRRWLRARLARWAFTTGLLAGAGLYAKLLFVWVIGGAAGAALALAGLAWLARSRDPAPPWASLESPEARREIRRLGLSALAFALGVAAALAPLAHYNAQTGGTFASLGANLETSYYGVNNADFAGNLRVRLGQLADVLSGREHLSYLGGSFANPAWPWALGLAAAAIALHAAWTRRAGAPLFLAFMLGLGLAQSAFTVSGLFHTHLAIFAPFWPLLLAAALTLPWRGRAPAGLWLPLRAAAVALFAVLWVKDASVTLAYHERLRLVGGTSSHTDAVYRLVDELRVYTGQPIYALDWGFAPQVRLLTRDAIQPQEIFGYAWEPDEGFAARLGAALAQPDAIYVLHVESDTVFPRRAAFEAAVAAHGGEIEPLALLRRRDTVPVIEIVRVR